MKTFPLIAGTIIMPSCAIVLVASVFGLVSARSSLDETRTAEAYSCAYLAGQYNIMNSMPTLFHDHHDIPSYCAEFKEMAAKHGFRHD